MNWRQSRQEDVARGAIILLISRGNRRAHCRGAAGQQFARSTADAYSYPNSTTHSHHATVAADAHAPTRTADAHPVPWPSPVSTTGAQDGRNIVCIDPGHGGEDLGNVRVENGRIVLQEKDFVLGALALARGATARRGVEVVLTRRPIPR